MTPWRRTRLAAPVLVLAVTLAACGTSAPESSAALTVTDGWVKAADSGMTGAFGTLVNATGSDITITEASSDASRMELHEMAKAADGTMLMRPKEGGFVVPARGEHTLAPGADHVMFMDLTQPLKPGDEVAVTLTADDGSSWTVTLPVRTFTGAQESYQGSDGGMTTNPTGTPAGTP
ncbi:copper chaperone PCu(A)C [Isoptericola sp. b441]|uniref:Copper chaperone PCu(A)C n=1 Tax=Actinotalea lenta TaxID=3064654 RepID=A0ABT9DEX8_9CELL|nr:MULTISPECIES: copper chaperone PCu(A)C [unclassified Isoptericola]MDO8107877.1 copper chaperone PCu(A)C [Isoptericola sp. b441]MDO8120453.1 copper chaperone PCu(A)C [Isoptericola sp. b490]